MDKNLFWQWIEAAKAEAGGDLDAMVDTLQYRLSGLSVADIMTWKQIFDEYQQLSYKEKLWAAACVINGGCSDDAFDYFRGWLTAQGKGVFMAALRSPDSLADYEEAREDETECEDMLSVACGAYFAKLGIKPDYDRFYKELDKYPLSDEIKAELASDIEYAPDMDDEWDEDELSPLLPKLCEKFEWTDSDESEDKPEYQDVGGLPLKEKITRWHDENRHELIIQKIEALPTCEWDYDLTNWLARAHNNLDHYIQAISLLDGVREQAQNDPYWHFRYGYALYYLDRDAEAAGYFQRAIDLGDEHETAKQLLKSALVHAKKAADAAEKQMAAAPSTMRCFTYKDGKSDKFWRIDCSETDYCVHYGKTGTNGRFDIKEFDSEEDCAKAADKQIAAKLKKGYAEADTFPLYDTLYFDTDEVGPHPKTSHPNFRAHFTDEIYYDCVDEEAPFGSDTGSDTLCELEDYIKKHRDIDIIHFPRKVIEDMWEMTYYPPETLSESALDRLLAQPGNGLPMSQLLVISDQVVVAAAFGQIKIMGKVAARLKEMALRSLDRIQAVMRKEGYPFSDMIAQQKSDLLRFENPVLHTPSDTAAQIMAYLDCPCHVFCGLLDDDDMIYAYERAAFEGKQQGYTPLLIAADDTLLEAMTMAVDEEFDGNVDREKIGAYRRATLAQALLLDPQEVFAELIDELDPDEMAETGKISGGEQRDRFSAFWDRETNLTKEVILAKIPTDKPWELPVYLPMGGFNDCPLPAQQAAIMKHWYERYGAVPGMVTYEEWEFILPQPVEDKETALALAKEHYAFCYDRVEQYAKDYTIGKLAHSLMQSTVWYFWWD